MQVPQNLQWLFSKVWVGTGTRLYWVGAQQSAVPSPIVQGCNMRSGIVGGCGTHRRVLAVLF